MSPTSSPSGHACDAGATVSSPAVGLPYTRPVTSVPSDPLIGRVLEGRYRMIERVGEGGMATVYRGLDLRLDRQVAVKIMRPHLFHDDTFRTRFLREARTAASLTHPHVVGVYDQGEDDGQMFLVMEFVHGTTLRHLLHDRGALTPGQSLTVLESVLQGLAAAHRAGLVHRDVKPENVLIGDAGAVKVADFGLARAASSHTLTGTSGVLLGTVAYLSPEQIESGVADARSDVYAAGLLLVEMLTGEKAFTGDTAIHVAYQHVHGGVPLPSSRNHELPTELDDLVATATARDPRDRPKDAAALLELVEWTRRRLPEDTLGSRAPLTLPPAAVARAEPAGATTAVIPVAAPAAQTTGYSPVAVHEGPSEPADSGRPRRRWPWLLLALLAAGGAIAWYLLLGPGAQRIVPDVRERAAAEASAIITAAELSPAIVEDFHETVAPGVVIGTEPAGGAQARRGSTVRVIVSKGPERYAVPVVAGQPLAAAEQAVADANLTLGEVTYAFDEKAAKDTVISSDPGAGKALKRGAAVSLVVSKGREPITVTDFTGKDAKAATAALTKAGLKVKSTASEFSESVATGKVIRQSPSSGTLYRGDTVELVVSKGPPLVKVPNVFGMQLPRARQVLEDIGLTVKVDRFFGGVFGTVRTQSIQAGTPVPKGSEIVLTIV